MYTVYIQLNTAVFIFIKQVGGGDVYYLGAENLVMLFGLVGCKCTYMYMHGV